MPRIIIFIFSLFIFFQASAERVKVELWHGMAGYYGQVLQKIVNQFNASQDNYYVKAVYKGTYPETFTNMVAAFRAHQAPTMVQIFEIGTASMLRPNGIIVPLYKLWSNHRDFLPAVKGYYADKNNRLLGLPFNTSTPVLFYNKKLFEQAKLDPNKPPKTWQQVEAYSRQLLEHGVKCGFTTTWPVWIELENFTSWHHLAFANQQNGFAGLASKVLLTQPMVIKNLQQLHDWQKNNIFMYGGRADDARILFTSGQCAMMLQSSGSLTNLQTTLDFPIGVGPLPYWQDAANTPQNTIIGGGAIWVLARQNLAKYQAAAAFLEYLSSPAVQAQWVTATGYLPTTKAAYELLTKQGYYDKHPAAKIGLATLNNKPPTEYSRGIRLGNMPEIRTINNEAMEAIFSGMQSVKQALQIAERRDNAWLARFANATSRGDS